MLVWQTKRTNEFSSNTRRWRIVNVWENHGGKEYKTRHDWVSKVIHWELCKKFKFNHTNKWYKHNPALVLENDTQTPLGFWHTNGSPNLSQKTRPYTWKIEDFSVLSDHRIKLKENEKKDKYLDLARELKKKNVKQESDNHTNHD